VTCELFVKNPDLLRKAEEVRWRGSEAHFPLFPAAITGAATEFGMENAIPLEWPSREFRFVELGEPVSQHPLGVIDRVAKKTATQAQEGFGAAGADGGNAASG
jgi:hypothetical protein